MKKLAITIFPCLFAFAGMNAHAQTKSEKDKSSEKTEIQEIIIKKKGDKDRTITITFKGEDILIDGRPLIEYDKNGDITVGKRKLTFSGNIAGLESQMEKLYGTIEGLNLDGNMSFNGKGLDSDMNSKSPLLGVTTEQDKKAVMVVSVTPKSAAEEAGIKKGDVIYKVNGDKVESPKDLSSIIEGRKVEDKVRVYFKRDGKKMDVEATLKSRSSAYPRAFSFSSPEGNLKSFTFPRAAPEVERFNFEYDGNLFSNNQKLGLRIKDTEGGKGVSVEEVDEKSNAEKAGFKRGDILTELDGEKIKDTNDARMALRKVSKASAYSATVLRNGKEEKIEVKIVKPLKEISL